MNKKGRGPSKRICYCASTCKSVDEHPCKHRELHNKNSECDNATVRIPDGKRGHWECTRPRKSVV